MAKAEYRSVVKVHERAPLSFRSSHPTNIKERNDRGAGKATQGYCIKPIVSSQLKKYNLGVIEVLLRVWKKGD